MAIKTRSQLPLGDTPPLVEPRKYPGGVKVTPPIFEIGVGDLNERGKELSRARFCTVMELENAIKAAYDGNAVLFLGSGFSTGGKNQYGSCMKIGSKLSHAICDELGIEHTDDLAISSDRYLNDNRCKKTLVEFISFLKSECTCKETSIYQDVIAKLSWHRIYTTNYDNSFELCSQKHHLKRQSITITNKRYKASRSLEGAIVHINGFIETINASTFYEEFKITDESYTRNGLLESSWRDLFESDLSNAKAVIFIGYSLQYDQDIVRCIAQMSIKEKCLFVDIEGISPDSSYRMQKYGALELIGTEGFADAIKKIGKYYIPRKRQIELKGFVECQESDYQSETVFSSHDVFQLLAGGYLQRKFINQTNYCVKRKNAIKEIKDRIPNYKLIIVQSYLGNGKTVFLEYLASVLVRDYRVYFLENVNTFNDDINFVQAGSDEESILLIDDGDKYRSVFRRFGKSFPDKITVIVTCRTTTNIHFYNNLVENYGYASEDIYIHDLDIMDDSDIEELCRILNNSHLWGNLDNLSNTQKRRKIVKSYNKQVSRIFYLLLESKVIDREISKVMDCLKNKMRLREFVLAQAVNSICQLKFSYADICKFIHISNADLQNFVRDDEIKEIIDINGAQFIIRSPIYLQYLISNSDYIKDVIDILSKLFRNCSSGDEVNRRYEEQRRNMVSRSDLLLVISVNKPPSKEGERLLFGFYDEIKNLPTAKSNPFFWLQFAITALNMNDFELSDVYFKNAYAHASEILDFNTYQIDTHYARLLLLREIKTNRINKDDALAVFYEAHDLLYENSRMGKLDYSLRQTGIYSEYFHAYQNIMTEEEKEQFLYESAQFIDRFNEYFTENKKGTYNVRQAYMKYRKLFKNTRFELKVQECNQLFYGK